MRVAVDRFTGDYRIMRVVLASSDPIQTLQLIRSNKISIRTFLDINEMLDMKATIEENEQKRARALAQGAQQKGK